MAESGSLEVSENFGPISVADFSNSMIQIGFCCIAPENSSGYFGIASVARQIPGEG
jgi:hypothetical protein